MDAAVEVAVERAGSVAARSARILTGVAAAMGTWVAVATATATAATAAPTAGAAAAVMAMVVAGALAHRR